MATPKRKEQAYLDPKWLRDTAALAMKRGTAIIVSKSRQVYGVVPGTGGSVSVFYKGDDSWIDAILAAFPNGAVFPSEGVWGGQVATKALKAYANIRLPDEGGRAWIDPVTFAVHVKGLGTTIHSASVSSNDSPLSCLPCETEPLSFDEDVSPSVAKLLSECVISEATRPALGRIVSFDHHGVPHVAATDGKSAAIQKCGELPEGFSVDPKLVGLFDIVSYGAASDKVAATTTRTYGLKDGTTVMERIGDFAVPDYSKLFDSVAKDAPHEFVGTLQLNVLLDAVKEMGLGANDSFGGVIRFAAGKTEILSMGASLAEFDVVGDFPGGCDFDCIQFSVPLLRRVASIGGGLALGGSDMRTAVASAGGTVFLAMPLKTVNKQSEGGATA